MNNGNNKDENDIPIPFWISPHWIDTYRRSNDSTFCFHLRAIQESIYSFPEDYIKFNFPFFSFGSVTVAH